MKSIRISGISSICKCVGLNWGIVRVIGKYDGSAEDEKNAARRMENEENEELRTRKAVNRRLRLTVRLVNALNSHQLPNRSHRNIGKIQKPNDTIPKDTNNMHRLPWKWAWLPLLLLITAKLEQVGGKTYLDWARTDSQLTRLPFFGGGVGHLLRYLHPLSMSPHPNAAKSRSYAANWMPTMWATVVRSSGSWTSMPPGARPWRSGRRTMRRLRSDRCWLHRMPNSMRWSHYSVSQNTYPGGYIKKSAVPHKRRETVKPSRTLAAKKLALTLSYAVFLAIAMG